MLTYPLDNIQDAVYQVFYLTHIFEHDDVLEHIEKVLCQSADCPLQSTAVTPIHARMADTIVATFVSPLLILRRWALGPCLSLVIKRALFAFFRLLFPRFRLQV